MLKIVSYVNKKIPHIKHQAIVSKGVDAQEAIASETGYDIDDIEIEEVRDWGSAYVISAINKS